MLSGCTAERHWGGSNRTGEGGKIKVGLVTKTESNPYFIKLRDAARAAADAHGAELIALAGKFDGDNEGQVTAIENLVRQGVSGILITPPPGPQLSTGSAAAGAPWTAAAMTARNSFDSAAVPLPVSNSHMRSARSSATWPASNRAGRRPRVRRGRGEQRVIFGGRAVSASRGRGARRLRLRHVPLQNLELTRFAS